MPALLVVLLARNPVGLSERIASPPFPPRGQLYHFHTVKTAGAVLFFTIIFQYSQDETALQLQLQGPDASERRRRRTRFEAM